MPRSFEQKLRVAASPRGPLYHRRWRLPRDERGGEELMPQSLEKKGMEKRDDVRDRTVAARAGAWGWRERGSECVCVRCRAGMGASERSHARERFS